MEINVKASTEPVSVNVNGKRIEGEADFCDENIFWVIEYTQDVTKAEDAEEIAGKIQSFITRIMGEKFYGELCEAVGDPKKSNIAFMQIWSELFKMATVRATPLVEMVKGEYL